MDKRYSDIVVRAVGELKIRGTAIRYYDGTPGSEYNLLGDVWERIAPGAFDNILRGDPDVLITFNHNMDNIVGRTSSGTARLYSMPHGIDYEVDLPDSPKGHNLYADVMRGDVRGSSFMAKIGWQVWSKDGNRDVRTITRFANLIELGPVTSPAYTGTSVTLRSLQEERDRYLATQLRIERLRSK